jgi:hypothetical protein
VTPASQLVFGASVSLLFATAFALAFIMLVCVPSLMGHLGRLVKCAAVVSLAVHMVSTTWPALPEHPWARSAMGIGLHVANQLQLSAWDALASGSRLLLPLLVG